MPLSPEHPDEPALHHQLRDALNAGLDNTDFFLWIDVEPSGEATVFSDLTPIIDTTSRWLASQDLTAASGREDLPELRFEDGAGNWGEAPRRRRPAGETPPLPRSIRTRAPET